MECPKCGKEMKKKVKKNIQIDECHSCGCLWFDADQLRRMKDAFDKDLDWMDFDIWKHEKEFRVVKNPRKCPKCRTDMVTIQYGNTNVEIDYCTKCKGILLERGEFSKIIRSLEHELLTKSVGLLEINP